MDNRMTNQVTYNTVYQDGFVYLSFLWSDTGVTNNPEEFGVPSRAGIIFNLPPTGNIKRPVSFTYIPENNNFTAHTITIYLYGRAQPPDFSASNYPGITSYPVCRATGDGNAGDFTWSSGVPFTYQFGRSYAGGIWTDSVPYQKNLNDAWAFLRSSQWNGHLALAIVATASGLTTGPFFASPRGGNPDALKIVVSEWPQNTGHEIGGPGKHRATFCQRSGIPMPSSELVEDGFIPGLNVHPDWYEPEDYYVNKPDTIPDTERQDDQLWGEDD